MLHNNVYCAEEINCKTKGQNSPKFYKYPLDKNNAASLLLREGNRLYSYLLNRVKSLPHNYTIYYLTLIEQFFSSGININLFQERLTRNYQHQSKLNHLY